jgi:hypothetical protein
LERANQLLGTFERWEFEECGASDLYEEIVEARDGIEKLINKAKILSSFGLEPPK